MVKGTRKRKKRRTRAVILVSRLSERSQRARDSALHVLSAMRRDPKLSLSRAARLEGTKPQTVKKYFSTAISKSKGKFQATKSDRYSATLYIPDAYGNSVPVRTHSSEQRKQISNYLRDLGRYLRGNRNALAAWHGKRIAGVELLTAGNTIRTIEPALSDFSLYRAFTGGAA
jgi:hypothetical protein